MTSPETLELAAVEAALAGRYVAPEHAELAELALLLRDDRPEPSAAWATRLDRRVEAGFQPGRERRLVLAAQGRTGDRRRGDRAAVVVAVALFEPAGRR